MADEANSTVAPSETTNTAVAQIEEARRLALIVQARLRRVMAMTTVLLEAAEHMDAEDGERVRICAEIAQEAASTAEDESEAIEMACNATRRALAGEA